jgi:hypothetical protein
MANPNPYQARQARSERRNKVLEPIFEAVVEAVTKARELLQHEDPHVALRAVHGVSQAAASAAKIYESTELASRLEALESREASNENNTSQ